MSGPRKEEYSDIEESDIDEIDFEDDSDYMEPEDIVKDPRGKISNNMI